MDGFEFRDRLAPIRSLVGDRQQRREPGSPPGRGAPKNPPHSGPQKLTPPPPIPSPGIKVPVGPERSHVPWATAPLDPRQRDVPCVDAPTFKAVRADERSEGKECQLPRW